MKKSSIFQNTVVRISESSPICRAVVVVLAMFGCVFLSSCVPEVKAEWKKYDIEVGNFSISLPSVPKITQDKPVKTEGGPLEMTLVESENGSAQYAVGYADVPGGNILPDSPQGFFDQMEAYIVRKYSGTVTKTKEVPLGRFTGREIQMSTSDGTLYFRLFYVRRRFFVVSALIPSGGASAGVSTFLQSFKLLRP